MSKNGLMTLSYKNGATLSFLQAFSDYLIVEPPDEKGNPPVLVVARLGGQPSIVQGMASAIFGGGALTVSMNSKELILSCKKHGYEQRIFSNDVNGEIVLYPKDPLRSPQAAGPPAKEEENKVQETGGEAQPRTLYLFCPTNDTDFLFRELDKKTYVPLIPQFKNYVLEECQRRGILKKLTVYAFRPAFEGWKLSLSPHDKNLRIAVEDGLKSGQISIPGSKPGQASFFQDVRTVSQYLKTFGTELAERIKRTFLPRYDPTVEPVCGQFHEVNDYVYQHTGYRLYDAQLAVAEGAKRALDLGQPALVVAECGTGKTKIGAAAAYACYHRTKTSKAYCVVMCPAHMQKKWVREIGETVPDAGAVIIHSIADLKKSYEAFAQSTRSLFVIISKETARDGYMRYPAVIWSKSRKTFTCPDCGASIMMPLAKSGASATILSNGSYFLKETRRNHKCEKCGTVLWAPVLGGETSATWAKITGFGFVHRATAYRYFRFTENPEIHEKIAEIQNGQALLIAGARRRYPISLYIRKKMCGSVNTLICDELHNYNNNSGQGDAMHDIAIASSHFIGLTATLVNGYASGLFYLLFRLFAHKMRLDHQAYDNPKMFAREYGVIQTSYTVDCDDVYHANRRTTFHAGQDRQLPGVSPLIYSRFLIENAIFLSLIDLGKDLPEYEEIPVPLALGPAVMSEYKRLEDSFVQIMRSEPAIGIRIRSAFIALLTAYPDQPYSQPTINSPLSGEPLVTPQDTAAYSTISAKDVKLLEIAGTKVAAGEKVIIYTSWTRLDTQKKVKELLEDRGYSCAVLTTAVSPARREEWIQKKLENGLDILITNPSLLETGLDLIPFTTLIYYNLAYNLFTLRQSSRRSLRVNQMAPRIEVYFLYYCQVLQERAIHLMATKLSVAGVIEGHITDEGLAALGNTLDLTSELAKELVLGIQTNVEDLTAVFKKMAITHGNQPATAKEQLQAPPADPPAAMAFSFAARPAARNKKDLSPPDDKNQLSMFDLMSA